MVKDIDIGNFHQVLRDLQWNSGMTAREIADKAGVSDSTMSAWFNNKRSPNLESLCYVLDVLGYKLQVTEKWRDERE